MSLDPAISVRYVNTSKQLAVVLTKGSFTLAQWSPLMKLVDMKSLRGHSQFARARKDKTRLSVQAKEMSDDSYTRSALSEKHGFSHSWDS